MKCTCTCICSLATTYNVLFVFFFYSRVKRVDSGCYGNIYSPSKQKYYPSTREQEGTFKVCWDYLKWHLYRCVILSDNDQLQCCLCNYSYTYNALFFIVEGIIFLFYVVVHTVSFSSFQYLYFCSYFDDISQGIFQIRDQLPIWSRSKFIYMINRNAGVTALFAYFR